MRALAALGLALALSPAHLVAMDYAATPESYVARLGELKPGDRLLLRPGTYRDGLAVHGVRGTADAPIAITGPASGAPAIFLGRDGTNTVSIRDSAHVAIRRLVLDGRNLPVDAVRVDSRSRFAHHIALEDLVIVNHGHDQQIVGISAQAPAWNWTIRRNVIVGAGTGMYLGSSDGRHPFVHGVIEHNLILDTIGYNLQIKHQRQRPDTPGLPVEDGETVIRGNVFVKGERSSLGRMARPNLLVGHFPPTGPGMEDRYLIEGNIFFGHFAEALFQGEGNITLLHNLLISLDGEGIAVQAHHDVPRRIEIAHNLIATRRAALRVRDVDTRFPANLHDNEIVDLSDARNRNDEGRYDATAPLAKAIERWMDMPVPPDEASVKAARARHDALRLACGDPGVPDMTSLGQTSRAQTASLCSLLPRP
jgi:hypothetical protein